MSAATIYSGGLTTKDPQDKTVMVFNWEQFFDDGVTVSATLAVSGPDGALTLDNVSALSARKTKFRLLGGTLGKKYVITGHATSDEVPVQEKDASFTVLIANK